MTAAGANSGLEQKSMVSARTAAQPAHDASHADGAVCVGDHEHVGRELDFLAIEQRAWALGRARRRT